MYEVKEGGFYVMITSKQSEMIELLIEGHTISDIARALKVSRNTVYSWKDRDECIAELNRRKQELRSAGNQRILHKLDTYINNIQQIAMDDTDKRSCLAANQYLINRIYGSPTTVVTDDIKDESKSEMDTELLQDKLKELKLKVVK